MLRNVTSVGLSSVQIFEESVNGDIYSIYLNVSDLTIEGIYSVTGSHHIVYPIVSPFFYRQFCHVNNAYSMP